MPDPENESLIGTLFVGRFRIEKLIGVGGIGVVYLGTHEVLQRKFAIKVIRKNLLSDLSVASRFRREARAASRIDHPHLTYVFDYGHSPEGLPYLAMEHVEGPSLEDELSRIQPFPISRGLHILVQIAEALSAAHANLVVHRDLKPSNIVLTTQEGRTDFVKILDFGLAKIIGTPTTGISSREEELIGTPIYMSPEQCRGEEIDHRSDIYSLGVLAFEMLTGELPFQGTVMSVLTAHVHDTPPVPSGTTGRTDFPGQMDRIILRCLEKSPEDRYQHAVDLLTDIQPLYQIYRDAEPISRPPSVALPRGLERIRKEENLALAATMAASTQAPPEVEDPRRSEAYWDDATDEDSKCKEHSLQRHTRALEDLAFAVRDLGLGSMEISHVLAQKVEAEELRYEIASSIALLEADLAEIANVARERESRLRQALSQLEHERSMLARQSPRKTMAWDGATARAAAAGRRERTQSGEFSMQDHRLGQRILGLQQKMQKMSAEAELQQRAVRLKLDAKHRELQAVHAEVDQLEAQLSNLLSAVRSQILETKDPELIRLMYLVWGQQP